MPHLRERKKTGGERLITLNGLWDCDPSIPSIPNSSGSFSLSAELEQGYKVLLQRKTVSEEDWQEESGMPCNVVRCG